MPESNHYATLGLARACTAEEIRTAYRALAKRWHPDIHGDSSTAREQTRALNAAYEILSNPRRRSAYDRELDSASRARSAPRGSKIERNITQDVRLRIADFLQGASVEVQVRDAGNPAGPERYELQVPPGTAPGARFRLPRAAPMDGGYLQLRLKALPGHRFKVRGSDLRGELRIDHRRAVAGGSEPMEGPTGRILRIPIPAGVKRGELVRIPGEGMPRPRGGGRGDLLVRITYRPEVRVSSRPYSSW
ncbi:MAG: DnaJ domain-containing protein [Verrucomicrobiota bacterium]|nr:DnaJ domain-containing protein [Verrucomicrobiota bacterium]